MAYRVKEITLSKYSTVALNFLIDVNPSQFAYLTSFTTCTNLPSAVIPSNTNRNDLLTSLL